MNRDANIAVEEALSRIAASFAALDGLEDIALPDGLNRVLVEPLVAGVDVPARPTSAMDGVALRACDIEGGRLPVQLRLMGRILAGHQPDLHPGAGQCVRIMTGALLPEGTDTVVMQEDIEESGDGVRISASLPAGTNVRLPGEQWRRGDVCVDAAERLTPADLQTAAMLGVERLVVRRAPCVAILSSGDEVQALGARLMEGGVFDSNRQFLLAALKLLGASVIDLGIVADDARPLENAILSVTRDADLLITTGGASQGDADHVARFLDAHARTVFAGVAMKPGRPVRLAMLRADNGRTLPIMALPGSPGAMMTAFYVLVVPAIARLCGLAAAHRRIDARMVGSLKASRGKTQYVPASLHYHRGHVEVHPASSAGARWRSASASTRIDGYIELEGDCVTAADGDSVTVLLI